MSDRSGARVRVGEGAVAGDRERDGGGIAGGGAIGDDAIGGGAGAALPLPLLVGRGVVGGVLMGLANLVPGISGGTMLLAAGVYPLFITAIAEITTLQFRLRSIVSLGVIAGSAVLAILLLAGGMKTLVVEYRWVMYSLFIGLTLGGLPLVWRLSAPRTSSVFVGAGVAFALMVVMALGPSGGAGSGQGGVVLLTISGLAGASAMILPGVSGGYLLLLLGQYEAILGAIDLLKRGLLGEGGSGFQLPLVMEAMGVVVPVGIGVVAGIVGVSNLIKWLLERYEKATLGVLLGLLLGAVVGLFPFQRSVAPEPGFVLRGSPVPAAELSSVPQKDWPLERFSPSGGQLIGALLLIAVGFGATGVVARLGGGNAALRHEAS